MGLRVGPKVWGLDLGVRVGIWLRGRVGHRVRVTFRCRPALAPAEKNVSNS